MYAKGGYGSGYDYYGYYGYYGYCLGFHASQALSICQSTEKCRVEMG
jgi:hypothetical protein